MQAPPLQLLWVAIVHATTEGSAHSNSFSIALDKIFFFFLCKKLAFFITADKEREN